MLKTGFNRSCYDSCVYHKWKKNGVGVFLLLDVDDMLIASVDRREILFSKDQLSKEYEMKALGRAKRILGMQIDRDRERGLMFVSQGDYIKNVVSFYHG